MKLANENPNSVTLVSLVSACTGLINVRAGESIHSYAVVNGLELDVAIGTALVEMYSKCGHVEKAFKVFNLMREKNLQSWTIMISGLADNSRGNDAISLFAKMIQTVLKSDSISFSAILSSKTYERKRGHRQGYFHRDLKPSNLLVSKGVIKIGDLGMVKEIDSNLPCTDYVTTRWYRGPEVLLFSEIYGPEVDKWAMGAIMFEMLSFGILFPGKSSADQIYKICQLIGSPTKDSWPLGIQLASNLNWKLPQMGGVNLLAVMPSA
ncbi:hypothetical protein KPL70_002360 [Citrus sinensis]|nr:hypothetical protein KPL70_002360 [Citrus sinensis]KAH9789288.1 hypothetical protein KPL71_002950 [Citrus sinensis]GAY63074.1 hypothetical protein CUMW_222710 [Citrus unshiu]